MGSAHPIARTLLSLLDNQVARTEAAFEDLDDTIYRRQPGGECNSIQGIGRHLLLLRRFQLQLLESPFAEQVEVPEKDESIASLLAKIHRATNLLREAIISYQPDDWYTPPPQGAPREGHWGDEPTIQRFARPFNDFTNHVGSIRAIRRILGNPTERVQ
jgi:hypothetical protein